MERRSRMRRQRTGKPLALTERDLAVFRWLTRYRYLRSTYLHAFAGGASGKRFTERLGDLFHEGFIDRPAQQWRFADARCNPVVYEIGEGARHVLAQQSGVDCGCRTFLSSAAHRQFLHSVAICDCLASMELATRARPNVRFIPWSEILARAPETTRSSTMPFRIPAPSSAGAIIPDGIFGLEYRRADKKSYRFFALELDRGTMPVARTAASQTSYAAKLNLYRAVIGGGLHNTHLGIPNFLVLTVTTDRQRLQSMASVFRETPEQGAPFLFKALEPKDLLVPAHSLLLDPWDRGGLPHLRIAQ